MLIQRKRVFATVLFFVTLAGSSLASDVSLDGLQMNGLLLDFDWAHN